MFFILLYVLYEKKRQVNRRNKIAYNGKKRHLTRDVLDIFAGIVVYFLYYTVDSYRFLIR